MKKHFVCIMLFLLTLHSFSQQLNRPEPLTRQDYLKKSKGQLIGGCVLLGTGIALIAIAAPGNISFDILPVIAIGAIATIVGSIPLFIASIRNKIKARHATVYLQIQKNPALTGSGFNFKTSPALSIQIDL